MNARVVDARSFILIEGIDDFVELRLIASHIGDLLRTNNPEVIRERSLVVLEELLTSNLIVAGTLDEQTGELRKWSGTTQEVLDRIEKESTGLEGPLGLYRGRSSSNARGPSRR